MKKMWLFVPLFIFTACSQPTEFIQKEAVGYAQGSSYQIKYIVLQSIEWKPSFDSIFRAIDLSMSTYHTNSLISHINEGDTLVEVDSIFMNVLRRSLEVAEETNGLFDPTIGPVVDFWGFGINKDVKIDSSRADSVKRFTGFHEITIKNDKQVKIPEGFRLDFNAIAQGYTVDVIAAYLEENGVERYMVEVGGEVIAKGLNIDEKTWKIGVDKPTEEIDRSDRFQIIVELKDKALATSGNYRKFWTDEKTGIKYAHTIDPRTGYPAKNRLLSVSILADNAMDADAYATACMVMGREKAWKFIESKPGIEAYFIYSNDEGKWETSKTTGFDDFLLN